jgi:hypothetical protein
MSSNTFKKVTKRNKPKTKKKKGGVKLFSKSKSVSNTNNDEKDFITNQNEMINELNSELLTLDKQNKTLNSVILTLNKQNEMLNEKNNNNKKTCDLSLINDTLIPISYMRISKRFPHLNLQEIIDFEKIVRENGGSIETHSGLFILSERRVGSYGDKSYTHKTYNSWTCCWNAYQSTHHYQYGPWYMPYRGNTREHPPLVDRFAMYDYNPRPPKEEIEAELKNKTQEYWGQKKTHSALHKQGATSTNLKNPRPELKCDRPEIFYLNEEDEKLQKVNIEEINSVINNNIDIFKKTIDNYSAKINELENIKTNIN